MEDEKQALSPVLAPIESDFDTYKCEKLRPCKCVRTWATPDSMFACPHFDRFVRECVQVFIRADTNKQSTQAQLPVARGIAMSLFVSLPQPSVHDTFQLTC